MTDKGRGILGNSNATSEEIRQAMEVAVFRALREHKRAGNPVAGWDWEKNQVRILQPDEIEIPEEYEQADAPAESGPADQDE